MKKYYTCGNKCWASVECALTFFAEGQAYHARIETSRRPGGLTSSRSWAVCTSGKDVALPTSRGKSRKHK